MTERMPGMRHIIQQIGSVILHYTNMPMQYTAIFHGCKNVNFQMKIFNIFLIFALKH